MARHKNKILEPAPLSPSLMSAHSNHLNTSWWGIKQNHDFITSSVGKAAGEVVNFYGKVVDNPIAERVTNGVLMKGWRALLFTNRAGLTRHIDPASEVIIPYDETSHTLRGIGAGRDRTTRILKQGEERVTSLYRRGHFGLADNVIRVRHKATDLYNEAVSKGFNVNYHDLTGKSLKYAENANRVRIYNLTWLALGYNNVYVELQLRPKEIEVKPETSWASIKSMGRNNPMYHYLGGEEELHLNIDWFLKGNDKGDPIDPYYVINMCRILKSWTYANGYNQAPPVLMIEWGISDIFANEYWILTSATYNLSDFHDTAIIKKYKEKTEFWNDSVNLPVNEREVEIINSGLTPYSATQELIFKKVSDHNTLHQEIANQQTPNSDNV